MKIYPFSGLTCILLTIALTAGFTSCKKSPEPLSLFGEWKEKDYDFYENISHSQRRLILSCPQGNDTSKSGEFTLYIKSKGLSIYQDSALIAYQEYVKGLYYFNESNHAIRFEGDFYTDSLFETKATDSNTSYSVGEYYQEGRYLLDEETLTLNLEDSTRTDFNTYYPVEQKTNCY